MDSRSFAAPGALLAAVLGLGPGNGMVLCLPAREPAAAAPLPDGADASAYRARLFAPTRQAVFLSRSGDRCAFHGGGPARG